MVEYYRMLPPLPVVIPEKLLRGVVQGFSAPRIKPIGVFC
jgi:hypothetical protein